MKTIRHSSEPGMLLDIASYARRGPGRDRLTKEEIELISRTVNRTPEVMVKVLSRGGQDLRSIRRHLEYLDRNGTLNIETDDGQRIAGKGVEKSLLEEWNLDLEDIRRRADLGPRKDRRPPKLVHKILFSMPPGTPPDKVLEAVKNFAREEFALKHRYALVLHTDEPHPHVHVVLKAVSEQGIRLNISKTMLRHWRSQFAENLRQVGVAANATERAVRGVDNPAWRDAVYRAARRADSTLMRDRVLSVALELRAGGMRSGVGKQRLQRTRGDVERGWLAFADAAALEGMGDLADQIRRFVGRMPAPRTDREWLAENMTASSRERAPSVR